MKYLFIFMLLLLQVAVHGQSWTNLGPSGSQGYGNGRVYAVDFHPTDPNQLYVGGLGGAWKSNDGGNNFTLMNTDAQLYPVSTVGSIAVDQVNPSYIYMSTGTPLLHKGSIPDTAPNDFFYMSVPTTGIYRSSNGGSTWQLINSGLPSSITTDKQAYINSLVLAPYDPQTLFAVTSVGIFKTTNAQAATPTWVSIPMPAGDTNKQYWLLFEPGSTAANYTIYVCNEVGVKYTTDCVNWNWITGTGAGQINPYTNPDFSSSYTDYILYSMDIHPTLPSVRYINVFAGNRELLYKYNGSSWTAVNVFYYDGFEGSAARHNIVIDRGNTSRVIRGGGYINYYLDGSPGQNLRVDDSYWNKYAHGDHHFLKIAPHNSYRYLYTCNDGRLTKIDLQASLNDKNACIVPITNNNLCNAWLCTMSVHPTSSKRFSLGLLDDGSFYANNGLYTSFHDGDGFSTYIGYKFLYTSAGWGATSFTTRALLADGTLSPSGNGSPGIPNGESQLYAYDRSVYESYTSPIDIYVTNKNIHLYRYDSVVYKNTKYIQQKSNFTDGRNIIALTVYPKNPNIAYIARGKNFREPWCDNSTGCTDVYKTTNLTSNPTTPTWTKITSVPDVEWSTIKDIEVSPIDSNVVFIAYSNNSGGHKLKVSYNGGTTWSEYNNPQTLPEIFEIAYEPGSYDRIYATTANGIFYTDKNMSSWSAYNTGYPAGVWSRQLYIHERENKITTGTLGRGVWQGYLYCAPATNLLLTGTINSCRGWETRGNISSSANIANGTGKVNVTYRAGSEITLTPGFQATTNSFFNAYILPCGGEAIVQPTRMASNEEEAWEEHEEEEEMEEEFKVSTDGLNVYPNPTMGNLEILLEHPEEWKNLRVEVYSQDGKLIPCVFETMNEGKKLRTNLSNEQTGYYTLHILSDTHKASRKVLLIPGSTEPPNLKK